MKKNILVIGTGSIANRHIKNILRIDKSSTIDVLSGNYDRSCIFCKQFKRYKIKPTRYNNVINKDYTHVVIASNTLLHNKYIRNFANKKNYIYCEKPLPFDKYFNFLRSFSTKRKNREKIKIGFQFRFNPAINFLKKELKKSVNKNVYLVLFYCGQNLKNWRKNSNYKKLYAAGRKTLASVHWELCHEIDILQYIFDKPKKLFSKLTSTNKLNLKISDVAITTFKLKNASASCVISVEMLSPVLYRKLIVGTTNNYYELDLVKNIVIKKNKKTFKYIFKKDRNLMFADYMKCFLSNKKKSKKFDFATLKDGINVTQIIKTMIKSDKTKKFISI